LRLTLPPSPDFPDTNHTPQKQVKLTLSTYDIVNLLLADQDANWSRPGALAMAEYMEEMEEATGKEIELDVCAIRCDFSESASLQEWLVGYYGQPLGLALASAGIDLEGEEGDDEIDDLIRDHISDHGQLIEFDGGIIVSSF
jgi:hypothetical protein